MQKYFMMSVSEREADVYIFGNIRSWKWNESDVSSYTLSKELKELDVDHIRVHINSYGGEVSEGLAIYNILKAHKAKVTTICDGFACSIASVIFMAGDERVMNSASLLMIHEAWTWAGGTPSELRKEADDLEKIGSAVNKIYKNAKLLITDEELDTMIKAETWILPAEALEYGFATSISNGQKTEGAAANAKKSLFNMMKNAIVPRGMTTDPDHEEKTEDIEAKTTEPVAESENQTTPKKDALRKMGAFFNAYRK